jgi:hypothetical protein
VPLTDIEEVTNFERAYAKRNKSSYTTNQGVTGDAFHTGKIFWSNSI